LAIEDNNLHEFLDQMSTLTSNINTRVDNGNTFLMLASWAGNKEIVKDLLLRNADINL
jgi:ankyrin repeat protein